MSRVRSSSATLAKIQMTLKQRLAQTANDAALHSGSRRRRLAGRGVRHALCASWDPLVTIDIGCFRLLAPLSHQLPHYQRAYERYGLNVGALARLVCESNPAATMIDVGANIGDTAAIVRSFAPQLAILCIEGDPSFALLLKRNLAAWPNIEIEAPCLLDATAGEIVGRFRKTHGTAHFDQSQNGLASVSTLDNVLASHPRFFAPALVKSDTDGFEARVLAGAAQTLASSQPVLFLEYHPDLLAQSDSDGLEMIGRLRELGYGPLVVYDNFGYPVCRAGVTDVRLIEDLHRYARSRKYFYFDLAIFPAEQSVMADELYARETLA